MNPKPPDREIIRSAALTAFSRRGIVYAHDAALDVIHRLRKNEHDPEHPLYLFEEAMIEAGRDVHNLFLARGEVNECHNQHEDELRKHALELLPANILHMCILAHTVIKWPVVFRV